VRRGLGRGRSLIAIGAILSIIAMPLPWLTVGGIVLSERTANGFEGSGVVMFLASVGMLALIVLPYTTKTRRLAIDRPVAYLALLLIALAGLGIEAIDLFSTDGNSLMPLDAPGLWLAIAGMAIATWGVLELFAERPSAP
jgi:hypothetical protein